MRTVSEWVERRELEAESGNFEQTRMTLRVSASLVERLRRIGEQLDMSRTACAEELLECAVDEAWDQLNMFGRLSTEELIACGYRVTKTPAQEPVAVDAQKDEAA